MKLIFMGTPHFAVQPLRALAAAGHTIAGVVTRTDKPVGRGQVFAAPPVKQAALELGLRVLQPKRVREPDTLALLRELEPDAIIVAAYGQILPGEILSLPKLGCINIHASLLPSYRGAAPINWAIIHGEQETGNTIMQMDEGMDTGAILLQERIPITPEDTAGTLMEKLSVRGARLLVEALPGIAAGTLVPVPQDESSATYAPILKKGDGLIDWSLSARAIHNRVRGLSPWPGVYSFLGGKMVKLMSSEVLQGTGVPGAIHTDGKNTLCVGTGSGMLQVLMLQVEGKKPVSIAEFLRGHREVAGMKFEARHSNT